MVVVPRRQGGNASLSLPPPPPAVAGPGWSRTRPAGWGRVKPWAVWARPLVSSWLGLLSAIPLHPAPRSCCWPLPSWSSSRACQAPGSWAGSSLCPGVSRQRCRDTGTQSAEGRLQPVLTASRGWLLSSGTNWMQPRLPSR